MLHKSQINTGYYSSKFFWFIYFQKIGELFDSNFFEFKRFINTQLTENQPIDDVFGWRKNKMVKNNDEYAWFRERESVNTHSNVSPEKCNCEWDRRIWIWNGNHGERAGHWGNGRALLRYDYKLQSGEQRLMDELGAAQILETTNYNIISSANTRKVCVRRCVQVSDYKVQIRQQRQNTNSCRVARCVREGAYKLQNCQQRLTARCALLTWRDYKLLFQIKIFGNENWPAVLSILKFLWIDYLIKEYNQFRCRRYIKMCVLFWKKMTMRTGNLKKNKWKERKMGRI